MRVLAVDPALRNVGYVVFYDGVLKASGHISAPKDIGDDDGKQVWINKQLARIIKECEIQMMIWEKATGKTRDFNSIKGVFIPLGWMVCLAGVFSLPFYTVTPFQAKEALTGKKRADKSEMIAAAQSQFNISYPEWRGKIVSGKAEHIADAAGVYQAGKNLLKMKGINIDTKA